jgi:hypothetical protein
MPIDFTEASFRSSEKCFGTKVVQVLADVPLTEIFDKNYCDVVFLASPSVHLKCTYKGSGSSGKVNVHGATRSVSVRTFKGMTINCDSTYAQCSHQTAHAVSTPATSTPMNNYMNSVMFQ